MPADVTLLLPVYVGAQPAQLDEAIRSSVHRQTRRPDAVVVVADGPLTSELDDVLDAAFADAPVACRVLRLDRNVGLARALNAGLEVVATEYVARMDADDVAHPERLERQLAVLESRGLDLIGAGLAEFSGTIERVVATRTPPVGEDAIRRRATFAQPFNHPSVIYRASAVRKVGGYSTEVGRLEDYVMFARLLVAGAKVDNLPEPLVYYRVDDGAYRRRGGLFREELRLQRELRSMGLTSRLQWLRNVVVRGAYRLAPTWARRVLYRII